jgi:hypothetical protein
MNLEEEQRRRERKEEQLAITKFFENIREQASDIMDGFLNLWDKSTSVAQVRYHSLLQTSLMVLGWAELHRDYSKRISQRPGC